MIGFFMFLPAAYDLLRAYPLIALPLGLLVVADLWWVQHRKWDRLNPIEQNLRRASQGFAVCGLTVAFLLGVYGWRAVVDFFPWLVSQPDKAWPGAVFFGALLVSNFFRFILGARRLIGYGVRDGMLQGRAFWRCAAGVAVLVWLGRLYPWPGITEPLHAFILFGVLTLAAWFVAVSGVRFVILSWPQGSGPRAPVDEENDRRTFRWPGEAGPRRWWQFWKRWQ